jgi:hypothetical protein
MNVPVNDKLLIRMVNTKRIRYGSKITSPHVVRESFNHDVSVERQILRRILRLRRLYSVLCRLKQEKLHVLMGKVYFEFS